MITTTNLQQRAVDAIHAGQVVDAIAVARMPASLTVGEGDDAARIQLNGDCIILILGTPSTATPGVYALDLCHD